MSQINSKRVLKNTIYLYSRMLLGLVVSLITARVILDALGLVDYGLNDLVGGMVSMFAFITTTLSTSASRFMSYSIGKGEQKDIRKVFSNAFIIHLYVALIIIMLGESIGVYLVNYVLDIPNDRLFACNVLWQAVILGSCIIMLSVPMSALVISYERMNVYAYVGMFDIFARLTIVFLVKNSPFDKLISLAFLNLSVSLCDTLFYYLYCKSKFPNVVSYEIHRDKEIQKSMLGLIGWNIIGSLANMLRHTGLSMLLNVFFGPIANAANAIAYRVNNAIMGFTGNFTTAVNPQITKSYAAGEYDGMENLIFRSGKLTYYMLMFICFPIIFECEYILHLWLGSEIPQETFLLTRLVLVIALVDTFTFSIGCAVQATGQVKNYQLVVSGIALLIFPVSWILFKCGYSLYWGLIVYLTCSVISLFSRLYFLESLLHIRVFDYCKNVFFRTAISTCLCAIYPMVVCNCMTDATNRCIYIVGGCIVFNSIIIWIIGLSRSERDFIKGLIFSLFSKIRI